MCGWVYACMCFSAKGWRSGLLVLCTSDLSKFVQFFRVIDKESFQFEFFS